MKNLRFPSELSIVSILLAWSVSLSHLETAMAEEVVPAEKFLEVFGVEEEEMDRLIAVEKPPTVTITINFETDSAEIQGTHNTSQLDQLGKALQSDKLKKRVFSIEGHTDSRGDTSYNLKLSQRRSQSVVDYLVTKFGVGKDNLNANGQGEFFLLDKGDTPEAHAKNRRVEIVLNGSLVE